MLELGQKYTSHKSQVTGTVMEIVANPTGTFRVRLDVDGNIKWTTYIPEEDN